MRDRRRTLHRGSVLACSRLSCLTNVLKAPLRMKRPGAFMVAQRQPDGKIPSAMTPLGEHLPSGLSQDLCQDAPARLSMYMTVV